MNQVIKKKKKILYGELRKSKLEKILKNKVYNKTDFRKTMFITLYTKENSGFSVKPKFFCSCVNVKIVKFLFHILLEIRNTSISQLIDMTLDYIFLIIMVT